MKMKKIDTINKSNKKFIVIISIISLLVIIAFCINYIIAKNKEEIFKHNKEMDNIREQNNSAIIDYNEVIEYKTEWTYEELLNNLIDENKLSDQTNIKIMVNNEEFDNSSVLEFDTVGSYKVVIYLNKEYSYKIKKETTEEIEVKKEIILNVEDTIYPVIEGVSDKTIPFGSEIDLSSGISATDEVEGEIAIQVEGEVDTRQAGTYTIKVYAIDENGNRTDAEFTVTVEEEIIISPPPTSNPSASGGYSTPSNPSTSNGSAGELTAAEKDSQARVIAKQIADSILAKGYTTDIDKVSEAAAIVSSYYYQGVHKESGSDYYTAYGVFIKGESSCAGTTRALGMVLEYMGYNWYHANENQWTHQWVIVTMDGQVGYADGQIGWAGYGNHPLVY